MALAESGRAIGMVTRLLGEHLNTRTGLNISIGRPDPPPGEGLNIFLYEAQFDESLKNVSLDEGQPAPIWLVLRYMITAFDTGNESDSVGAHEYLGRAAAALQELSFMPLPPTLPVAIRSALEDNPEPLKITFEDSSSDLLSRVMQGSDERYRFSLAFQVRPVLIAPATPPNHSLLVGVDYSNNGAIIGTDGVAIPILASTGPFLESLEPNSAGAGDIITLKGSQLNGEDISVRFGSVDYEAGSQTEDSLSFRLDDLAAGNLLSPGFHSVTVVQKTGDNRSRSSNPLGAGLLPNLQQAQPMALVPDANGNLFGEIRLTGSLLGGVNDHLSVAFYRDGKVRAMSNTFLSNPPDTDPQTLLRLDIPASQAIPPGLYHLILRVNGQQARISPLVELAP